MTIAFQRALTILSALLVLTACGSGDDTPIQAGAAATTSESDSAVMERGLGLLYQQGNPVAAEGAFRQILQRNPTHYGATYQLAIALDRGGRPAEARPVWLDVQRLAQSYSDSATMRTARERLARPDTASQEAMMTLGLDLLYRQNDPAAAAEQFRGVLRKNPTHYGATYQLASALDKSGQAAQARPLWQKVLGMATTFKDEATAKTARERLGAR